MVFFFFFFNDTATTEIYTLSLHDALPICKRLGKGDDLSSLYKLLGDVLKQRFKGWTAYILSGNKALARAIGLKSAQRWPIYNGTLPCQLMKYELY